MKKLIINIQLILSLNAMTFAQDILINGFDSWSRKEISNSNLQMQSSKFAKAIDTIYSFPTPGTFPLGLAWDGDSFWNSDISTHLIYKLSKSGEVLKSFSLPSGTMYGGDLTWDGSNLWLVDEQTARLVKIDTSNGSVIASFRLPDSASFDPNSWGLAWDGKNLWHSQYGPQHRIFKLNPMNGEVISSFEPFSRNVLGIEWINGFIYGINLVHDSIWHSSIYKFDPSSGIVIDSASWEVQYPMGLIWDGINFWNVSSAVAYGGMSRIYKVSSTITTLSQQTSDVDPRSFILFQNYPNPFNPITNLEFGISDLGFVTLKVYDILGKEVVTLVNEKLNPGIYKVEFDGSGLTSGVYFYRLASGEFTDTKRMFLVK